MINELSKSAKIHLLRKTYTPGMVYAYNPSLPHPPLLLKRALECIFLLRNTHAQEKNFHK